MTLNELHVSLNEPELFIVRRESWKNTVAVVGTFNQDVAVAAFFSGNGGEFHNVGTLSVTHDDFLPVMDAAEWWQAWAPMVQPVLDVHCLRLPHA